MKILRAEIENFKPYEKVTLPQEGQLGEGLFLINGDNSMGKTSLIEAVLWGLLGDSLMDVKKKGMLVRTGESSCKVDITFELGGNQFRIVRKMTIRKSRNPKSEVQFNSDAVLSKKDGSKFVTMFSGAVPVNREVEKLLGITAENIEKTVYVRQKEVDKLALAEPKDLRVLVTGLFGLDEFDRVKENLSSRSSNLQDKIGQLQREVGSIPTEKRELAKNETTLNSKKDEVDKKTKEILGMKKELNTLPSESQIVSLRDGVDKLREKEAELITVKTQINEKQQYVNEQSSRIKKIELEIKQFESLRNSDSDHLKKIPSKEYLDQILQNIDSMLTQENSIKKLLTKSKIKLDFDPLQSPEKVSSSLSQHDDKIKELTKSKTELESKISHIQAEITSNKTLADLKKKSIDYVEARGNCPICKSIIKDTKYMIASITTESKEIKTALNLLESNKGEFDVQLEEIKNQIEIKTIYKDILSKLQSLVEELIEERKKLKSTFDSLTKKDFSYSNITQATIRSLISKLTELETNLRSYDQSISSLSEKIQTENKTVQVYSGQIGTLQKNKKHLELETEKMNSNMLKILHEFSVRELKDFLSKFKCVRIDELLVKHKSLNTRLDDREKILKSIKDEVISIEEDIKQRKARLKELAQKEEKLEQESRELKHVKFLKGEIDGFISNYIVEGKLSEVLRQTTNSYLTPFTDGRYVIDRIYPTVRRTKGMESHGLEISLMDNKDNMPKQKEQLSGGDETALGLALRIAISKLMAKIRPFKDAEMKPPMINSVMLDEPMASLDASRRRSLVSILTQDQSFKQMFLITHTDLDYGDYNSIVVNQTENGKRQVEYKPIQL
ncbi:MAG: AAA family ATPase [Nitrosotalea sp.]